MHQPKTCTSYRAQHVWNFIAADVAGVSASKAVHDASEVRPSWRYQDARDEALIAVEQVVIPRQQPIELLPQTPELLDMQV